MRGSVSVCPYKGRQIEKTCIKFFQESGLIATLSTITYVTNQTVCSNQCHNKLSLVLIYVK